MFQEKSWVAAVVLVLAGAARCGAAVGQPFASQEAARRVARLDQCRLL